jgi:HK97 family phage portal protein
MGILTRIGAGFLAAGNPGLVAHDGQPAPDVSTNERYGEVQRSGDSWGWLTRQIGFGKTKAGVAVNQQTAMTLPAVFAAISALSNPMMVAPARLYQDLPDGSKRVVTDHPAAKLFRGRANPRTGSGVFRRTIQAHAAGWGNGYAEIQRTRGGQPVGLWQLLPDRTSPRLENGDIRYHTVIDGREFNLPKEDVLHVHGLGFDGLVGYSPIALARESFGIGKATEEFGAKFFANDAKSGGFLLHPGKLGGPGKKNVRESFEDQAGPDNQHRVKVLEEGMKFISTTIPPDDAQFLATREFTVAEVARMFGVPLFMLQSMEKTSSWGTGIEQLLIGFVQFTLTPWAVVWEDELNTKLLTEAERDAGYYFKVDMRGLMRGDMAARAAYYGDGINDGWMTRADARKLEDLDPLDGLDEPLVPLNMATVAQHQAAADRDAAAAEREATAAKNPPPDAAPRQGGGRKSRALKQKREAEPAPAPEPSPEPAKKKD